MKPYELMTQSGVLSIEQELKRGIKECAIGIQIADDGRIWICVDGQALIRFKPKPQLKK